jgi:hypothetical protein
MKKNRGKLIVIEGVDHLGKSEMTNRLTAEFPEWIYQHQPDDSTPITAFVRKLAKSEFKCTAFENQMLHNWSHCFHYRKLYDLIFKQKKNVILDRFYLSALAYMSADIAEQDKCNPDLMFMKYSLTKIDQIFDDSTKKDSNLKKLKLVEILEEAAWGDLPVDKVIYFYSEGLYPKWMKKDKSTLENARYENKGDKFRELIIKFYEKHLLTFKFNMNIVNFNVDKYSSIKKEYKAFKNICLK